MNLNSFDRGSHLTFCPHSVLMSVELTEALLSKAAGWDVMKRARACLEQGHVLSSYWAPPLLRGVVQAGEVSFRASMVIKSGVDIENLCTCREAREWGKICAHGVAVGLHWLKAQQLELPPARAQSSAMAGGTLAPRKASTLQRDAAGEPAELFIIFPPNFDQAVARGKVMLVFEAKWSGGRCPLNALPKGRRFAFSPRDAAVIDRLEVLMNGETPAVLQFETKDFTSLLPALADHPNITLGKASAVTITKTPFNLPLRATLERNGEIVLSLKDKLTALVMIGDWVWRNNTLQPLGLPPALKEIFRAPVRLRKIASAAIPQPALAAVASGGRRGSQFQTGGFYARTAGAAFPAGTQGRSGATKRAAAMRLRSAHHDRWRDGGRRKRLAAGSAKCRRAIQLATWARSARRWHDCSGSGFSGPDGQGKMQLLGQNAVLNFFAREFPKLQREWSVTLEERLERSTLRRTSNASSRSFKLRPRACNGSIWAWYSRRAAAEKRFPPAEIQRLLLSGQSHTRLRNGKTGGHRHGRGGGTAGGAARLRAATTRAGLSDQQRAGGFSRSDLAPAQPTGRCRRRRPGATARPSKAAKRSWNVRRSAIWKRCCGRTKNKASRGCNFCARTDFGGILADEMGLGKTLQTLAFLRFECGCDADRIAGRLQSLRPHR